MIKKNCIRISTIARKYNVIVTSKHVYEFDPTIGGPTSAAGWRSLPPLKHSRKQLGCAMLNNRVIVAGGYGTNDTVLKSTEIMDMNDQSLTSGGNLAVYSIFLGIVPIGEE